MQAELLETLPKDRLTKPKPWIVATDGSADHVAGLGAYAWVAKDGTRASNCAPGITSSMAEWSAIIAALTAAPDDRPTIIYSDFRNAVKILNKIMAGSWPERREAACHPLTRAYIQDLRPLLSNKDVTIIWIRSHTGHRSSLARLNKSADHLAKSTLRRARSLASDHYII